MFQLITAVQPLLIGALLIWAASVKLFGRHSAAVARRSALVPLIGEQRALPAYRALGGVELAVGAMLVLPPAWWPEAGAATALAVGFLGYLTYARVAAPDSSCGCLSAQRVPVTWRALVRAGVLVIAGALALLATDGWWSALAGQPLPGVVVLVAEAAVIVALSAELDTWWLLPLRRLQVRLTHPLRGGFGVPLLASVQQLQRSLAYRQVAGLLTSDVREFWDEGEWRMMSHAARYQGRPVTAVFAVPRLEEDPDAIRVALVDDATGATLWALTPQAATPDRLAHPDPELALGT